MIIAPSPFIKQNCSRCKQEFEIPQRVATPKAMCRECMHFIKDLNLLEKRLLEEEFSIEQTDKEIVVQINALLLQEDSEQNITADREALLSALIERLILDQDRRKKILRDLLKLQKKK